MSYVSKDAVLVAGRPSTADSLAVLFKATQPNHLPKALGAGVLGVLFLGAGALLWDNGGRDMLRAHAAAKVALLQANVAQQQAKARLMMAEATANEKLAEATANEKLAQATANEKLAEGL